MRKIDYPSILTKLAEPAFRRPIATWLGGATCDWLGSERELDAPRNRNLNPAVVIDFSTHLAIPIFESARSRFALGDGNTASRHSSIATYIGVMHHGLSDVEAAALIQELHDIVESDRCSFPRVSAP